MTSYSTIKSMIESRYTEIKNCGANAPGGGGFRSGNTCARGGGSYEAIATYDEFLQLKLSQERAAQSPPQAVLSAASLKYDPGDVEFWDFIAEKWGPTGKEQRAVEEHIRLSTDLNSYLRRGEVFGSGEQQKLLKEGLEQRKQGLDLAFSRPYNVAPRNMIIYRGPEKESQLTASSFTEKGFPSTSWKPLAQFSQNGKHMTIRVPKGFPLIFGSQHEYEMILPRNVKFTRAKDGIFDVSLKKKE